MADRQDLAEFVTHVLQGARFKGAVPVEVLPEMAAYRDLIVAVARALFFKENEGRQRVPRGFESGFQLVLREQIGEGSAAVRLQRAEYGGASGPQLSLVPPPVDPDFFDRARDLVDDMIEAVATPGAPLPSSFPLDVVSCFNTFGRTLRDDESILIKTPRRTSGVTYDRKRRKQLILLKAATYEDVADVVGEVVQFDRQKMTFDLLVEGNRVSGRLDELDDDSIRIVFTAGAVGDALKVRVTGVGAYDAEDRLTRLVGIAQVQYAEDEGLKAQLDVEKRLGELGKLAKGWLNGEGVPLDGAGVTWMADTLKAAEGSGLPRPYLYPTPEGGLQAEWSFHGAEVSAEIDLATHQAELVGVHTKTGASSDKKINLGTTRGIDELVAFVNKYAP